MIKLKIIKATPRLKVERKAKRLASTIVFDEKIARSYHKVQYYEAMASEISNLPEKEVEKEKYRSPRTSKVTNFIKRYKTLLEVKSQGAFKKIMGIYNKNVKSAKLTMTNRNSNSLLWRKNTPQEQIQVPTHSNLLYIVSSLPILMLSYRKIRGNKGAHTLGYILSESKYQRLRPLQKSFVNKTFRLPDGMSREIFKQASQLIRQGKYPWGASRRVYIDKPGQPGVLRPITIPPFMDRVVQGAIVMVLEAIYEPWFEAMNASFGFRPRKGVHDAIFAVTNPKSSLCKMAIEGDIKAAYDRVNREKLIEILSKRIIDRKFLKLIRERLDYSFWDTKEQKYITPDEGLPQGGIDSPYLWNIYMMEFDQFVLKDTQEMFDKINEKVIGNKLISHFGETKGRRGLRRKRTTLEWMIRILNAYPQQHKHIDLLFREEVDGFPERNCPAKPAEVAYLKRILKDTNWASYKENELNTHKYKHILIKELRLTTNSFFKLPHKDPNKVELKFVYARYADDWIVLTSAPRAMAEALKSKYKDFLNEELKATLSEEKTLITNIKKNPAHFLGFELRMPKGYLVRDLITKKGKRLQQNLGGKQVFTLPDRQRLISRLHMKGYCDKRGFPREIGYLSHLEPYAIVERYNSVLRGMVNYYAEFVKYPKKSLARWVYIVRYSCLKTLAQKYSTTIRGILKRFGTHSDGHSIEKTVSFTVRHVIASQEYEKTWTLLTLNELVQKAKEINRLKEVTNNYYTPPMDSLIEQKPKEGSVPCIKDDNFLDRINWVNLRTQASLDSPCALCGSSEDVEMHHIRHVRKKRYELIPEDRTWEKVMSLRNRKQIPVCKECHINVIHPGKYGGTKLGKLVPKVMFDNRLVVLETHINRSKRTNYFKTLTEKGWVRVVYQDTQLEHQGLDNPQHRDLTEQKINGISIFKTKTQELQSQNELTTHHNESTIHKKEPATHENESATHRNESTTQVSSLSKTKSKTLPWKTYNTDSA